jgi:hypothetical protein
MNSVNPLQNNSALAQLLSVQKTAQAPAMLPSQASASQTAGADSLSISAAALQALQGLGQVSTQTSPDQALATYKAHGHHHHHHGSASAPQGASAQPGSTGQNIQVSQADQTSSSSLQAKG